MTVKWPLQRDCDKFYGNPRGVNDKPSAKWETANLVSVKPPFIIRYAGKPISGIRIHKKAAESLKRILAAIWEAFGRDQKAIDAIGMSVYGGAYNYRLKRGGSTLSMHSYGAAVDFDPARNGFGDKTPAMDKRVIAIFEAEGWEWGGHWSKPDGMHFQAAWTRANPPRLASAPKPAPVKPAPKPAPVKPAPKPALAKPADVYTSVAMIQVVQAKLTELGYPLGSKRPDGTFDGKLGTLTKSSIRDFRADNGLPDGEHVDRALVEALDTAKPRKLDPKREQAPEATIREAVPEVRTNFLTKIVSSIVGLFGLIGSFFTGVLGNLGSANGYIAQIKEAVGEGVPVWIWFALVFIIGGVLFFISRYGEKKGNEAFRGGARL